MKSLAIITSKSITFNRFLLELTDSLSNNFKVTLCCQDSENINNLKVIKGDLRNINDIKKAFESPRKEKKSIEAVIHLAGLKAVGESCSHPLRYWENNLMSSINLLKVLDQFNCKNIVFSSSATVYKSKLNKLLNENDYCEPVNPYGQTKLSVEKLLDNFCLLYTSPSPRDRSLSRMPSSA